MPEEGRILRATSSQYIFSTRYIKNRYTSWSYIADRIYQIYCSCQEGLYCFSQGIIRIDIQVYIAELLNCSYQKDFFAINIVNIRINKVFYAQV